MSGRRGRGACQRVSGRRWSCRRQRRHGGRLGLEGRSRARRRGHRRARRRRRRALARRRSEDLRWRGRSLEGVAISGACRRSGGPLGRASGAGSGAATVGALGPGATAVGCVANDDGGASVGRGAAGVGAARESGRAVVMGGNGAALDLEAFFRATGAGATPRAPIGPEVRRRDDGRRDRSRAAHRSEQSARSPRHVRARADLLQECPQLVELLRRVRLPVDLDTKPRQRRCPRASAVPVTQVGERIRAPVDLHPAVVLQPARLRRPLQPVLQLGPGREAPVDFDALAAQLRRRLPPARLISRGAHGRLARLGVNHGRRGCHGERERHRDASGAEMRH